jgi:hypothetical protein
MSEKPAYPASPNVAINVVPDSKQSLLDKSRARQEKLLKEWRESEARRKARVAEKQKKQREAERRTRRQKKQHTTKTQGESCRRYNQSEKGKARFQRYRQSSHGKAKLREKYEERKRWLDEIKAERGCYLCGERDIRVLQFRRGYGQKIKFLPTLQNTSRSMEDWREVIQRCRIICVNCLIKKKRRGTPALRGYLSGGRPRIAQNPCVNAAPCHDPEVSQDQPRLNLCRTCGAEFKSKFKPGSKRKQEFCSPRCRLLRWAIKEILKVYRAGRASGLQGIVAELAGTRR